MNEDLKERLSELESINREMQEKIVLLTSGKEGGMHTPTGGVTDNTPASGVSVCTQTDLPEI